MGILPWLPIKDSSRGAHVPTRSSRLPGQKKPQLVDRCWYQEKERKARKRHPSILHLVVTEESQEGKKLPGHLPLVEAITGKFWEGEVPPSVSRG